MKMKNKQGDIPITILVIGVFAVCTLAILSFFASSISTRNSFVGVDYVEGTNLEYEKNRFAEKDVIELYNEINETNYLPWTKDVLKFSVKYEPIK